MIPLDAVLARQAVQVAAEYRLRGSDADYAAVALRFDSILVTLDRGQRDRVAAIVTTCHPLEALTDRD